MNIFYVDEDPVIAAKMLCNSHVCKLLVEQAQILSTAHRILDEGSELPDVLYKVTHKNHPSSVWARESFLHYSWLYKHFEALCDEYTYRYGRVHLTDTKLRKILRNYPKAFSVGTYSWNPPPKCIPDECKISDDTVECYREYYNRSKRHIFSWTRRMPPSWVRNYE